MLRNGLNNCGNQRGLLRETTFPYPKLFSPNRNYTRCHQQKVLTELFTCVDIIMMQSRCQGMVNLSLSLCEYLSLLLLVIRS